MPTSTAATPWSRSRALGKRSTLQCTATPALPSSMTSSSSTAGSVVQGDSQAAIQTASQAGSHAVPVDVVDVVINILAHLQGGTLTLWRTLTLWLTRTLPRLPPPHITAGPTACRRRERVYPHQSHRLKHDRGISTSTRCWSTGHPPTRTYTQTHALTHTHAHAHTHTHMHTQPHNTNKQRHTYARARHTHTLNI